MQCSLATRPHGTSVNSCSMSDVKRVILACVLILAASITAAACPPLLDLELPTLTEDAASLCRYEGKVLLVVNTASECGYTPQYEGLEALHRRYKDKGLVVLGFPSNDFGAQEPGSNKEIARFCEVNYGVSFPMFAKSAVAKGTINPFYARLAQASNSRPRWNFHKYLVDRKGERVLAYESAVTPNDPKFVRAIERLLAE
jgi:glutathione peroxidase